jgi:hypothetical protein
MHWEAAAVSAALGADDVAPVEPAAEPWPPRDATAGVCDVPPQPAANKARTATAEPRIDVCGTERTEADTFNPTVKRG